MDNITKEFWERKVYRQVYWRGVQCLKIPNDLLVYQEIIFDTLPDYIIETGTWNGGSALFMADICQLVHHGQVITIDTDLTLVNNSRVLNHPRIMRYGGNSLSDETIRHVRDIVKGKGMVVLDNNHSREHVAKELELYCSLVGEGCYLIVEDGYFDTIVFDSSFPYNGGPVPAIQEFLINHPEFERDVEIESKFLATFNPWGYLRKAKESDC